MDAVEVYPAGWRAIMNGWPPLPFQWRYYRREVARIRARTEELACLLDAAMEHQRSTVAHAQRSGQARSRDADRSTREP